MRLALIAISSFLALAVPAGAQEPAAPVVKGIFLLTDYPAVTVRPGGTSTVNLRLQNYATAPERMALTIIGVPAGWTATLIGGGQPIAAALPASNANVALELRLDVPRDAAIGTSNITVTAKGASTEVSLPLAVTLAQDLPAKLTLSPTLPELRGNSRSTFEFQLGIKNESGKKLTVSLGATAPQNFDATFTEMYGSQELNAIPIDPGQNKDVKLKIRPPNTIGAGKYEITARIQAEDATVTTKLGLDITGQPKIDITGREGRVSSSASAGEETSIPVIVINSGTAPAEQVELSGSGPSGWKVEFNPKTIDRIAPNETKEVVALITPTAKSIAGDYWTTLRASARGESASSSFRIMVTTSTLWGFVGAGLIGIALLVMVGSVAWFGRR